MKTTAIIGILFILLGALALAYQGISYTTEDKLVDIGPIEVTEENTETLPLPPLLGAAAIVGGVALLVLGRK